MTEPPSFVRRQPPDQTHPRRPPRCPPSALAAFLLLSLALARPAQTEEAPSTGPEHVEALLETLRPALASQDAQVRVAALRQLLAQTPATLVAPRLAGLATQHEGQGLGRAALEGLNRLAAPRMTAALDGCSLQGGGPEETGEEMIRSHASDPVRILPSVQERLQAVVPGSDRVGYADLFVALAAITQQLDVAFLLDAEAREVVVLTRAEAVQRHAAWLAGPGREALAWSDFLRDEQGRDHDALEASTIDDLIVRLLGSDPAARRRAAYVLGRCRGARRPLGAAWERANPAERAILEPILARHDLRSLGDVVLVSGRFGSPQLVRMRMDGGHVKRLTSERVDVYLPVPSPDGRHVAYHHDQGERGRGFAVVDLVEGTVWRPDVLEASVGSWSPDGRYLAWIGAAGGLRSLHLLDTETGQERDLGVVPDSPLRVATSLPAWAPDGHRIAYSMRDRLVEQTLEDGTRRELARGTFRAPHFVGEDLLVVRHEEGRDTLVRRTPNGEEVSYPSPPEELIERVTIAPDGTRAVLGTLWADMRARKEPGVYLLQLGGTPRLRKLAEAHYPRPLWSARGDRLAIELAYRSLSVLDGNGDALGPAHDRTSAAGAVWSPDGETLYAVESLPLDQPATPDLLTLRQRIVRWNAGTWAVTREVDGDLGILRVTPDDRWLILGSDASGDRELVAASTDGRLWIAVTEHPADDGSAIPLPP